MKNKYYLYRCPICGTLEKVYWFGLHYCSKCKSNNRVNEMSVLKGKALHKHLTLRKHQ